MKIRQNYDPEGYLDPAGYSLGEARSGLLDSLTATEKKALKAREASKTIGFAIPNGQDEERPVRK